MDSSSLLPPASHNQQCRRSLPIAANRSPIPMSTECTEKDFHEIRKEIQGVLNETEAATLALSSHLSDIVQGAEQFVGEIQSQVGAIDTDGHDGVGTTLASQCVTVGDFVKNVTNTVEEQSSVADQMIETSKTVAGAAQSVAEISMHSRILCFNTMVEAGRLGDLGRPFMVIAGEMRSLSEGIAKSNEQITRLAEELLPLLQDVKENIGTLRSSTSDFSGRFDDQRKRIERATDHLRNATHASLSAGDDKLASIIDRSNDALVNLQVQDLVSQRLKRILRIMGVPEEGGEFLSEILDVAPAAEVDGSLTQGEMELF